MITESVPRKARNGALCCTVILVYVLLCLSGCATHQKSTLYFAAADLNNTNPDLKFYRLTINTCAMQSKTQLQAGFYDANAVRMLNGEKLVGDTEVFKQEPLPLPKQETPKAETPTPVTPKDGSAGAASSPEKQSAATANAGAAQSSQPPSTPTQPIVFLDPKTGTQRTVEPDKVFTIVFGANADELAKQIEAFYSGSELGDKMGNLMAAAMYGNEYMLAQSSDSNIAASNENVTQAGQKVKEFSADATREDAAKLNGAILALTAALAKEQPK